MKSSAIVKKALHKAYGVLYPTVGRKDKVVIQYQVATSCNESFLLYSSFFCPPNFFEQSCFF